MLLIPAIDLKEGSCVRLKQGLMDQATVFSDEPAEMALHWVKQGARRLHLVDLDGAFAGKPKNLEAISAILQEVGKTLPVQLGGGIRDLATIEKYLDLGLTDVIIGTAAVKNPQFVREACKAFAGHIIVGLDAKEGMVAIDGWATVTEHQVADLGKQFADDGNQRDADARPDGVGDTDRNGAQGQRQQVDGGDIASDDDERRHEAREAFGRLECRSRGDFAGDGNDEVDPVRHPLSSAPPDCCKNAPDACGNGDH